jgi:replicative DNA helicase
MAGGLYEGFTYGFCAPQKAGKTTLAHTISHNLNAQGVNHCYIALEMGSTQIEQRNLARDMGLNSLAFLQENKSPDMIARAVQTVAEMPDHTLYLDMPGCTFNQLKAELSALIAKRRIKGFILDYWQLVGGCAKGQSKADFLYDVAQWCANFARKHKVWCIMLAQMNREGSVFGSGGLEKACDQLYYIEKCEGYENMLWFRMKDTRYTPPCSIGDENTPKFIINTKSGPFLDEI